MNKKVVLASNNKGKLFELKAILTPFEIEVVSQQDFNVPEAEETGLTFVENAILKARNACQHTKLPTIADDSGLEVDALHGRPGIYSARYAGTIKTTDSYCKRLLSEMESVPDEKRTARFQSVIVYMQHANDPSPLIGQGTWNGIILREMIGGNGFGYDPVFYVKELGCSVAQLEAKEKNRHSHRSQAMQALLRQLYNESS